MTARGWQRDAAYTLLALAAVAATSILGQIATYPNLAPWYAGLVKPAFNPPNWLFAPVWTALYLLMAFACWRILRLPPSPARRMALSLFFLQLALNAAWSWMFFALQSPLLGLVNIVPQCRGHRDGAGLRQDRPPRRIVPAAAGSLGRLRRATQRGYLVAQSASLGAIALRAL